MTETMIELVFQNMAQETLRRLRELRPDDPNAQDRTVAILSATLREAFNAGKVPSSSGLNHSQMVALKSMIREMRQHAVAHQAAATTETERLLERGAEVGYVIVEGMIEKLERA